MKNGAHFVTDQTWCILLLANLEGFCLLKGALFVCLCLGWQSDQRPLFCGFRGSLSWLPRKWLQLDKHANHLENNTKLAVRDLGYSGCWRFLLIEKQPTCHALTSEAFMVDFFTPWCIDSENHLCLAILPGNSLLGWWKCDPFKGSLTPGAGEVLFVLIPGENLGKHIHPGVMKNPDSENRGVFFVIPKDFCWR